MKIQIKSIIFHLISSKDIKFNNLMADIHVYTKSKASQCGRGQPTFMIFYHKFRMIIHFKALIYCQPNIVQTCAKEKNALYL